MALVDYFLKIDGIAGESQDAKHKGEIEIESFSWGVSQTGAHAAGGGGGAGKVHFHDLTITKTVDKASPNLFLKCASGEHIKQAVLTVRKAGERQEDFLRVTFSDVLISSFQDGGTPNGVVDASSLSYRNVTERIGAPTRIDVVPVGLGSLVFDPTKTPNIQIVDSTNGALVAGVNGDVRARGVAEYDLTDVIGLITAPFGDTSVSLEVAELRAIGQPPTDTTIVNATNRLIQEGPQPHLAGRFDVLLYQPADLVLTADDFGRHGKKIGRLTVDPAGPPASFSTDITDLLAKKGNGTFGIRIQLHGSGLEEEAEDRDEDDEVTGPSPHMIVMFTARLAVNSG
jgi:type VI secretion system secreted protein Hcp